ncbi:MAG TPA: hypothetical protein ACQGQG_10430 [Xylella sp.]
MLTPQAMKIMSDDELITTLYTRQALHGLTPIESELLPRLEALVDEVSDLEERVCTLWSRLRERGPPDDALV